MLSRQISTWTIFLLMSISCFCLPDGIAFGIEELAKISKNSPQQQESPGLPRRDIESLQSPMPVGEVKDKSETPIQREIQNFRLNKEWIFIEWSQIILVFAQFILVVSCIVGVFAMAYYSISIILNTKKDFDKKIEDTIVKIDDKVKDIHAKIDDIYVKIDDYSKELEQRYLYMEYVSLSIWDELCPAISTEISSGRFTEALKLWNKLYVAQLALRQMLSKDDVEFADGMAEIRGAAQDNWVNPEQLWDFICLLNEQKRLTGENVHLAEELGREIGKTFKDCKTFRD